MKILFITSAHNSLSQRLYIELTERGRDVAVCVAAKPEDMLAAVAQHQPDLIVAPMLKTAIPEAIWSQHTCLIVHPGIKGDRGPSSLDWAIADGETRWGVTILQAVSEMDAGPIWASHEFALPEQPSAKSSLYRHEVTEAAVRGVLQAVERFARGDFKPEPLDDQNPAVQGRLRPSMRQADRAIDWRHDTTAAMVRKLQAADSQPGVLDELFGLAYYLYGAHEEDGLKGEPGAVLAHRHGAICRGTVDGAVWITHVKPKDHGPYTGIKLPATAVLGEHLRHIPGSVSSVVASPTFRTFQEIWYSEGDAVGYLHFDFYNGAMSTDQCYRLRDAFLFARARPTRAIVLLGGRDFFSNGIHLNTIEAARDPASESWRNIHAIDDLIVEILNTLSHIVIAGLRGNAGAGGAMLALAADYVYARRGAVLNPHYQGMGNLYGSEYWTYTLPRRIGQQQAVALTEGCQPIGTKAAKSLGYLDDAFGDSVAEFEQELTIRATTLTQVRDFWTLLKRKHAVRLADERCKPLAVYRAEELKRMRFNFFGPDPAYHQARHRFVLKTKSSVPAQKSVHIVKHHPLSTENGTVPDMLPRAGHEQLFGQTGMHAQHPPQPSGIGSQ